MIKVCITFTTFWFKRTKTELNHVLKMETDENIIFLNSYTSTVSSVCEKWNVFFVMSRVAASHTSKSTGYSRRLLRTRFHQLAEFFFGSLSHRIIESNFNDAKLCSKKNLNIELIISMFSVMSILNNEKFKWCQLYSLFPSISNSLS